MSNEEEKEQKPKKMFEIHHIIYDDGEIDTSISEYRKSNTGRGAPGKWRLNSRDFKRRCEEILGEHDQIVKLLIDHIGDGKIISSSNSSPVITMVEDEKIEKLYKPKESPKQESLDKDDEELNLDFDPEK